VASATPPPPPLADLPATFTGKLPCANCAAIHYQLNLRADSSYSLRKTFEDAGDRIEDETGSWAYSSDRVVIVLKSSRDVWSWFAVPAPGVLRAVDDRGDSIGRREPADLHRSDSFVAIDAPGPSSTSAGAAARSINLPLPGVEWKLTELENKPVRPATKGRREILLAFDGDSSTYSGQSGCNHLEGYFETGWRTLIIKPRKPMRVCRIDDGTERSLSRTIKATRTFRITGTTLDLFDEQGGRVARLEGRVK
jgi:heat shock protein HslJ